MAQRRTPSPLRSRKRSRQNRVARSGSKMVDLAFKSLLHDKLKFAITVAGVAFAVMLVFVPVGLFMGLMDNATLTIQNTNADLWVTSKNTPNIDFSHTFPQAYVDRVRTIPGVE